VRKIEIAYPAGLLPRRKAGGARVCGVMTAVGPDPEAGMKYAKIIGEKEKLSSPSSSTSLECTVPPSFSVTPTRRRPCYVMPLLHWGHAVQVHSIHKKDLARAMVRSPEQAFPRDRDRATLPKEATVEDPGVKENGDLLRQGREARALSSSKLLVLDRSLWC